MFPRTGCTIKHRLHSFPIRVHPSVELCDSSLRSEVQSFTLSHPLERLATTTSADFCSITQSVSAPVRCLKIGRVLWLPCRFQQHLIQTPMDSRLLFEQISPDKNVNCLCTTAPFTVSLEPEGFVVVCQLAPKISAFYDGSVPRLTDLLPASSGHSLASLPLLLASGCRHWAPITFDHLDAGSTTGGLSPHKFTPILGVHNPWQRTAIPLSSISADVS